jgi:CBS-domain-containing membrane protein
MTRDPICCSEQDEIVVVLDLMKTHQVRRLPVVNEKHEVVGMLSLGDLVRMTEIEAAEIVRTLRRISEPTQGGQNLSRRATTAA